MPATFCLLLKRNFIIEKCMWRRTLLEILVAIIIVIVIALSPLATSGRYLRANIEDDYPKKYTSNTLEDLDVLKNLLETKRDKTRFMLAYAPAEPVAKQITEAVARKLKLNGTIGYDSDHRLQMQFDDRTTLAGIVFRNVEMEEEELPKRLVVAIRFPSLFRTVNPKSTEDRLWVSRCSGNIMPNRDGVGDSDVRTDLYIREGFLQLQHQIFMEWYKLLRSKYTTKFVEPHIEIRTIRNNQVKDVCPMAMVMTVPTFLLHFVFLLPFLNLIWNYAQQLEENVMVHEWHYGNGFFAQWVAIFFVSFLHMGLLAIIVLLIICLVWMLTSDISIDDNIMPALMMLVFTLVYVIGLILFAMVLSKLIVNKVNAVLFGCAYWVANYAIFCVILQRYSGIVGYYVIVTFIIFINNLFPFGMNMFYQMMHADGSDAPTDEDIEMALLSAVGNILLSLIILLFAQWCCPGPYMSRRLICRKKYKIKKDKNRLLIISRQADWNNFEFGNVGSQEMLRLRNICTLHKRSERKILKNVSFRAYKGEIFVIVGHIGSGKVTLLRVIGGLKLAHRGSISLIGEDYYANLRRGRRKVDFRMDHSGLPNYMTVSSVLRYFVELKAPKKTSKDDKREEYKKYWEMIQPYIESEKKLIKHLTYGESRLLSTCCAFAGNTPILLFDEPTQYLDSSQARAFWQILEREKVNRSIIVTTCMVDDVTRVADRIGVFNVGMLEASGTPFFLRSKFSGDLQLILLKKPAVSDEPITEFLQKYIPGLEPDNEIGDQLIYKIDKSYAKGLQRMLIALEKEASYLGIDSLCCLGGEVSDIYMKLVTSFRMQQQVIPDVTQTFKYTVVGHRKLRCQQLRAMLYKKLIHQASNLHMIAIIVLTVALILLIGEMSKILTLPAKRENNINLGFSDSDRSRAIIPKPDQCTFIEIKSIKTDKRYERVNAQSRFYTNDAFYCGKGVFMKHLKDSRSKGLSSVGAVEIDDKQHFIGWTTQDIFHSAPMTLNLLHNLILQYSYPKEKGFMSVIKNNPMPTPLGLKVNLLDNQIAHIYAPLTMGTVLPFFISVFIVPLVEENMRHIRILQILAGVHLDIYWFISFLWDFLTYFIFSLLFIIITALVSVAFAKVDLFLVLLLMVVFGFAAIPLTYFLSMFLRKDSFRAYLISFLVQILSGLVLYVIYWDVANSNKIFFYLASISPGFSVLDGLSNVYTQSRELSYCEERCREHKYCNKDNMQEVVPACRFDSFMKWEEPGIMPAITFMLITGVLFAVLIFWVELHRRERKFFTSKPVKHLRTACYPFDDADVADVKIKIAEADMHKCKQSAFLVDQLESELPKKATRMNTVSFALNKYTSMGVFGARKSGKTHLVKQLIGEHGFVFGEIYVRGLDFKYDLEKVQAYVGYCPQDYGYLNHLTPGEMIRLLCMIRGVPDEKIGEKIHDLSLMLNMRGWINRRISLLTYEKRRKVNIAISLIVYNKILILDEPTYGMPATTRREIWNILRYIRYCGKTIIFTTTEEVECKILSDFMILFDHHEMLGIGSLQYMRYKYSHGFYLEVRLIRDGSTVKEAEENLKKDVENLIKYVQFLHERSEMLGRSSNWLKFYCPVENIIYSFLYGSLEKNKGRLNISDYVVYQASTRSVMIHLLDTRDQYKRRQSELIAVPSEPPTPRTSVTSVHSGPPYERPSRRLTVRASEVHDNERPSRLSRRDTQK